MLCFGHITVAAAERRTEFDRERLRQTEGMEIVENKQVSSDDSECTVV